MLGVYRIYALGFGVEGVDFGFGFGVSLSSHEIPQPQIRPFPCHITVVSWEYPLLVWVLLLGRWISSCVSIFGGFKKFLKIKDLVFFGGNTINTIIKDFLGGQYNY